MDSLWNLALLWRGGACGDPKKVVTLLWREEAVLHKQKVMLTCF